MDPAELLRTAGRYRLSQAIYAAASLGVADHLAEGDKSAEELAAPVGADAPRLRRLMRALSSEGVFRESDDGRFSLAPAGRLLVSGAGTREMILGWSVFPATWAAFGRLAESIRVGRPAFDIAHGMDFHEYLARNPAAAREYDDAMGTTVAAFDSAAASYDFSKMRTVVDVGGGDGGFLVALLMRYPETLGINVDLPAVISNIDTSRIPAVVRNRLKLVGGDFFRDLLPAGDAFVLVTVLRLFEEDRAIELLRNVRDAMHPDSEVLALDFVHPPGPLVAPYGLADLHTMAVYGGRDRSEAEFDRLFDAAGLRLTRVIETGDIHSWVEGVPR